MILGIFGAIGRFFRMIGFALTGRVDEASDAIATTPHAVRATFAEIVREKMLRIQQYKDAVSGLMTQQEGKIARVKQLTTDVEKQEKLRAGGLAMAEKRKKALLAEGKSKEEIQHDELYMKSVAIFNDATSTLGALQKNIEELEQDIGDYEERIKGHKLQLIALLRELEKVKGEADETVADLITAKEEKQLADMISGIATDRTGAELSRMRDLRNRAKANARISKELAGTDTKVTEAEFIALAEATAANDEFDKLLWGAEETDKKAAAAADAPGAEKPGAALPE